MCKTGLRAEHGAEAGHGGGVARDPYFTARERAALAFTEAVTLLADGHVATADYAAVAAHFSPDEVAALLSLIVTINAWNAIGVTTRAWLPGSYQP
jgi:alkylhydroperoxidase family enzyme